MRILKRGLLIVLALLLIFPTSTVLAQASGPDEVFFSQTGHFVRGEFRQKYFSTPDYLLIFGYPITEEIVDQVNNHTVQYFQKARFDLVKTDQGYVVEIANLGQLLYPANGDAHPELSDSGRCQYFEKTGNSVCLAFLDFYQTHNGEEFFGDPISGFELEHDTIVQYFENVRLEWHPELPNGQKIVISDLGRIYFDTRVADPTLLEPPPFMNLYGKNEKIEVQGFVSDALVSNGDVESIYVVVRNQFHTPLPNVPVTIQVNLPEGKTETFEKRMTNNDGIYTLDYPVKALTTRSLVQIDISAQFGQLQDSTSTWFRVW